MAAPRIIRTIALELERIANHVGDLGALSGDVAFLPPANYCGRMRGDFLNMTLWICGNRFGKGLVRPGGVRFPLTDKDRTVLAQRIAELKPQVTHTMDLLFSKPSVRARFEGCGVVSNADAHKFGLVGPAGRACGISYDVRRRFPSEHYSHINIPENAKTTGDVYARARVRADEVLQSIEIVQALLEEEIHTEHVETTEAALAPDAFVVTLNEAWRGEVSPLHAHRRRRKHSTLQSEGSLFPQLERVGHVSSGYGYFRLSVEQQELQFVLLRVRFVGNHYAQYTEEPI